MSVWEKLQNNLNAKPFIKKAEFKTKYVSTFFADAFVKTAASLGVDKEEAISFLKTLDNAHERNNK